MRAHLVQPDIAWEDPRENFQRVDRLIASAPIEPGDLVVLPEMFAVGFSLNVDTTAPHAAGTLEYLLDLADDLGAIVLGGRPVRDCHCSHATNNLTAAAPGRRVVCDYKKIHPFSFGKEPEAFTGGDEVTLFDWPIPNSDDALKVCPAVCYDLRFPELFRLGMLRGAEVMAIGANWPEPRQQHWRALAIARAIENQAFVLAVNRTGPDPHLNYVGGTIGVSPRGEILGELGGEPGVLSVEIDPAALRAWRGEFPAWRDARLIQA
ncbi:MAG: nitrilase-related carbon-nitrogen hydrolase [Phycisphaerales bacterium]